ncbi:MAG: VOC family protein [Bryobacteraceae bacterium]
MPNNIAHFAINAGDVEQSRRFYEAVFGWKFQAWGPPGFYRIETGDGGVGGALQGRRAIVPGLEIKGYECTISVDSVDRTAAAVEAAGGRVVMPKVTLSGIGRLIFFQDPDGNVAGAMEYDTSAQ